MNFKGDPIQLITVKLQRNMELIDNKEGEYRNTVPDEPCRMSRQICCVSQTLHGACTH